MVSHASDGYIFVNEERVGCEEEIDHIIASGGHVHHLIRVVVERYLREF